jgi:hypothetical protein
LQVPSVTRLVWWFGAFDGLHSARELGENLKGTISKKLKAVLDDPKGREQLSEHLLHGKDGRVVAGDKSYALHIDVRSESIKNKKH